MIDKKLEALFSELTEEEINVINDSEINTDCELDPKIISRISENVQSKTGVDFTYNKKAKKSNTMKFRIALIAAAIVFVFTIGASAAYRFMMPQGLAEQLELQDARIKTVVDTEKVDKDSVKTMQKTVSANGYTVTFEAIVDGYVILPEFVAKLKGYEGNAEIREDKIYAIMTITRDDGKNVMYPDGLVSCSCCCCLPNYIVAVNGYIPDSSMFESPTIFYEEGNLLYLVCDITNAGIFADKDLSIIIYDARMNERKVIRMDEKGNYYFVDSFKKLSAIFDFDLDDSLADPEAVAKDMAERPYVYRTSFDYTEVDKEMAADEKLKNIDLSYAIGNHEWHGYYPLQFGEVEHAEDFIKLYNNRHTLKEVGFEAYNQAAADSLMENNAEFEVYIEQLAGKTIDTMTDDELNELVDEMEAFNEEKGKVSAEFLKERFTFTKFDDGSEYCYIEDFLFLYIPANSDTAKIVLVYGDRIVLSVDCTVDSMNNIYFPTRENVLPGIMNPVWYLFGVDEDSRYAKLYNEEDFKLHSQSIRSEEDAIFFLISEFAYYEGTVEVFPK